MNLKNSFDAFETSDIERNKVLAALAYVLFFIPLILAPDSRFGKFHANQGLLFLIAGCAGNFIFRVIPVLKWFMPHVFGVVIFALFIYGIVNALNGKAARLPVIGEIEILN